MNRKFLSALMCTTVIASQVSMISPVRAIEAADWTFSEFGVSTSLANNSMTTDDVNNTVTLKAGSVNDTGTAIATKGGKIDIGGDGLSYYYQAVDSNDEFELSADVKVEYFFASDSQTGFGIMARDTVDTSGSGTASLCNEFIVGGYKGSIQSTFRTVATGATTGTFGASNKLCDYASNTTYKLKLKKTSNGYRVSVNDGVEADCGNKDLLKGDSSGKIYVGFFASRAASITISNIDFKTSPASSTDTTTTGAGASTTTNTGSGTSVNTGTETIPTTTGAEVAVKDKGILNDTTLSTSIIDIKKVSPNIIVDANFAGTDGDLVEGIATYKTIKAAIGSISTSNNSEKIIFVKNGKYYEKLTIATPYITIIGESSSGTKITYDAANALPVRPQDKVGSLASATTYGTTGSASVTVTSGATNFKATNITFENSFDESDPTYTSSNKTGVAIKCEADHSVFVNCRFLGNQDTLYPNKNKQYFYKCYIEGDVDFIFGGAQAVFEQCEIHSLDRAGITPKGYVAAPSTLSTNKYGFLMLNCNLTSGSNMDGQVYLGRPWQPNYPGNNCKVVYKNCNLGAHIAANGWSTMDNTDKTTGGKVTSNPQDNYMYEYKSTGFGSSDGTNSNRREFNDDEANDYSKGNILSGWEFSTEANKLLSSVGVFENVPNVYSDNSSVSANKPAQTFTWNSTEFGASTSATENTINVDNANNAVTLTAGSKDGSTSGGKITGSQDGISYYYTVIDPAKNFELSADVKVNYFETTPPSNQAGFGIMARDTIGTAGDKSTTYSNMVLVGGYRGAIESVFRNGVKSSTNGLGATMEGEHKFADCPANDGTATYKLKLKKTNTGYIASVDNGEEVTYYRPKQLEAVDNKHIYLGFFAARVASIKVSNINLTTSDVATDPAGVPEPAAPVTPAINVTSSASSAISNYNLNLNATVSGNVKVTQNGNSVPLYDNTITAGSTIKIPSTLVKGDNTFKISYTPSTDSTTTINQTCTVSYKTYGDENGNIYVSQSGTENGDGTQNNPIDIYTAIKYTGDGQTIKVKGGVYKFTTPIIIPNDNSGTVDKLKNLTSYDGERAVFDFGKASAGFTIWGNYWKVYGIDVCNTADKEHGITVSGNNNVLENIKTYKNGDTGLQISGNLSDTIEKWPSNNLILNCESYDNMDAAMNNADGFAAKISVGYGNVFRGCISHNNCDDGWDLYTKSEHGAIGPILLEDCITYGNGTLTDGTLTNGDGNGFKLGGEGIAVTNTLKNSLAFNNNANGITTNSNPAIVVENCISADNKKSNIDLHYYTGAKLKFSLTGNISFRTTAGDNDTYIDTVVSDSNYFYDGKKTSNKSGSMITNDYFKSVEMPETVQTDVKGNIVWPDYMKPVNGAFTHSTASSGTTTGGTTTGGNTSGGTTTGGTTSGGRSSHHHKVNSVSSSTSTANSESTGGNTASTTTSTVNTSVGRTTADNTSTTGKTNTEGTLGIDSKIINLDTISKEQAKAIREQVVSNVNKILGEGTQISEVKEEQTSDGNAFNVTGLNKDGENSILVIQAEKSNSSTTVQTGTLKGQVQDVYKFIPLLDKYIRVTDSVLISKDTLTLSTQANATYVVVTKTFETSDVISEGWIKVDDIWYMVDKSGDLLTGWQKDNTDNWTYLSPTNAKMQTGWLLDGGKWYFLKDNGYMATGWVKTGDKWYYLNSDGSMASDIIIDGYELGSDGALK